MTKNLCLLHQDQDNIIYKFINDYIYFMTYYYIMNEYIKKINNLKKTMEALHKIDATIKKKYDYNNKKIEELKNITNNLIIDNYYIQDKNKNK